jgi:hypothetical protein
MVMVDYILLCSEARNRTDTNTASPQNNPKKKNDADNGLICPCLTISTLDDIPPARSIIIEEVNQKRTGNRLMGRNGVVGEYGSASLLDRRASIADSQPQRKNGGMIETSAHAVQSTLDFASESKMPPATDASASSLKTNQKIGVVNMLFVSPINE